MKLKIRKVEATKEEVFYRINNLLDAHEFLYKHKCGMSLKYLLNQLGIKELEFAEFMEANEKEFYESYSLRSSEFTRDFWLSKKYEDLKNETINT
jgi:hypothetical protein